MSKSKMHVVPSGDPEVRGRYVLDVSVTLPQTPALLSAALLGLYKSRAMDPPLPPLVLCVGAPTSTGDSLGPLTGQFLMESGYLGLFFGTLDVPVHAQNLLDALDSLPPSWVIGVDASVGRPGRLTLQNAPLQAGRGMGKWLPPAGDVNLMVGIAPHVSSLWFASLSLTYRAARALAEGLHQFHAAWRNLCGEEARNRAAAAAELSAMPPDHTVRDRR